MSTKIAHRYAKAFAELEGKVESLHQLAAELEQIALLCRTHKELSAALKNPLITKAARTAVVSELAERLQLSILSRHALRLLAEQSHLAFLPAIVNSLHSLSDQRKGLVQAEVITAVPLSDGYYNRLRMRLETVTGKQVTLTRKQDPTIIGGVITRIGDTVYDGSIRSQLEGLKSISK